MSTETTTTTTSTSIALSDVAAQKVASLLKQEGRDDLSLRVAVQPGGCSGLRYQRDEVIAFADIRGDSFKLAQAAADNSKAEFIFFCGVHFMAESADILTTANQKVILPDL